MTVPEGYAIGYECANGHVEDDYKRQPIREEGKQVSCVECRAPITRTLIPLRECEDCGNVWPYTGDADRPTCPDCQGKRTVAAGDE